jgi:hypothetical protein
MERHEDHEQLADELESDSDRMEERSDELGDEISDARDEWQRKRGDASVPGAVPTTEESDREQPGDEVNPEAPSGDDDEDDGGG